MKTPAFCGWLLSLLAVTVCDAAPVPIANPGFETQTPELVSGERTSTLTGWQETGGPGAAAGVFEFAPGFAAEGTDHLGMASGHQVWQDPGSDHWC